MSDRMLGFKVVEQIARSSLLHMLMSLNHTTSLLLFFPALSTTSVQKKKNGLHWYVSDIDIASVDEQCGFALPKHSDASLNSG